LSIKIEHTDLTTAYKLSASFAIAKIPKRTLDPPTQSSILVIGDGLKLLIPSYPTKTAPRERPAPDK